MISKLKPLWRGLSATFLSLLVVGSLGYGLADDWRSSLDNFLVLKVMLLTTARKVTSPAITTLLRR